MRCTILAPLLLQRLAPALMIAAAAVTLGACSNSRYAYQQQPTWAGAPPDPAPSPVVASSRYEAEAGDPIKDAPVEPLRRREREPDDPSQPYSPNYGGAAAPTTKRAEVQPAPVAAPVTAPATATLPDGPRPYFRRRIVIAGAD